MLKAFGYACFPHLVAYNKHKLMPKSVKCVFIGYDLHYKGYRCLDPITGRVYISRNVTFDELTFPFSELTSRNKEAAPFSLPTPAPVLIEPIAPLSSLVHTPHMAEPNMPTTPNMAAPPTTATSPQMVTSLDTATTPNMATTPHVTAAISPPSLPISATSTAPPASPDHSPGHNKFCSINSLIYSISPHPLPHALAAILNDPLSHEPSSYS
ncbi:hypothetical protein COP2_022337 [Malus domestica]